MLNNYDFLFPPLRKEKNIDYILFTDNKKIKVKGWIVKIIPKEYLHELTPSLVNRFYKLHPHLHLKKYDVSLYIDSNIRSVGYLSELFEDFIKSNVEIGLVKHPNRNNVKEEVQHCCENKKIKSNIKIHEEYLKYLKQGFIDNEILTENNILFRWHKKANVVNAMEEWWECLKSSAGRDQISFPMIRQKNQLDEKIYEINIRKDSSYFIMYRHKTNIFFANIRIYLSVIYKTLIKKLETLVLKGHK